MHTVIIGNGIIGMTIAFRLARRAGSDDRITLIGKKIRLGSATLAAGAMLNSFAEIEKDSLDSELDIYRFELSHLATKMWPKFERELIDVTGSCLPAGCKKCQGFAGGAALILGHMSSTTRHRTISTMKILMQFSKLACILYEPSIPFGKS